MNISLLKEVLSIPTVSHRESLMVEWLMAYFEAQPDCFVKVGRKNNVYVTKGTCGPHQPIDAYPLVCAHTDTVHQPRNVMIRQQGARLFAVDETGGQVGCGGDDKCGIYICLELMKALPVCKAAFFVAEECGCLGARACETGWFNDVGYAIEFDSPCDNILTFTSNGTQLFPTEGPFFEKVFPLLKKFGVTRWQHHPLTDVAILKQKFGFPCMNLPAGYFQFHTAAEYVITPVVENSLQLGLELVKALGNTRYGFDKGKVPEPPVPVTYLKTHDYSASNSRNR